MDWELWIHGYAKNWHDAFEILGAVGSAAAAGVAVWLASRERADRKAAERDRDDARRAQHAAEGREAQREREAQARKVGVWLNKFAIGTGPLQYHASFANYSELPVTNCFLIVDRKNGNRYIVASALHVEPGGRLPAPVVMEQDVADERPDAESIYIEFADAWNRHWRRTVGGKLSELTGERLS
ncbi:MAG: hypothetical protein K0R97_2856, partial [Oerskovia sp.]|nr:hypothetical protein [Oerskovia sp.]